jgi:CheY-like chemotaxis protein
LAVSLEKVRFLVVDDNAHALNIVRTMLRGLGAIHVFDARTPASCVACAPIRRAPPRSCR